MEVEAPRVTAELWIAPPVVIKIVVAFTDALVDALVEALVGVFVDALDDTLVGALVGASVDDGVGMSSGIVCVMTRMVLTTVEKPSPVGVATFGRLTLLDTVAVRVAHETVISRSVLSDPGVLSQWTK